VQANRELERGPVKAVERSKDEDERQQHREDLENAPEYIDDVEIPESTDGVELELSTILFETDFSDGEIEEILDTIRTGGAEEGMEISDLEDDYPDRVRFMLRLVKQTAMNTEEIRSAVKDVFPAKL